MEAARVQRAAEREAARQQEEEAAKSKAAELSSSNKARLDQLNQQIDEVDDQKLEKPQKFMF